MVTTLRATSGQGQAGVTEEDGMRRVGMAKMTRVWVASDSTNQPERNRADPEWNTSGMIAKVAKPNTELNGPK
jgi:DNA-binding XRE family transcriptional regulator